MFSCLYQVRNYFVFVPLQSDWTMYTVQYSLRSQQVIYFKYFKQINKSLILGEEQKIYFRHSIFINTSAIILKIMGGKQSLDSLHLSYHANDSILLTEYRQRVSYQNDVWKQTTYRLHWKIVKKLLAGYHMYIILIKSPH